MVVVGSQLVMGEKVETERIVDASGCDASQVASQSPVGRLVGK